MYYRIQNIVGYLEGLLRRLTACTEWDPVLVALASVVHPACMAAAAYMCGYQFLSWQQPLERCWPPQRSVCAGTCPKERRALVLLLHNLAEADAGTAALLRRRLPQVQLEDLVAVLGGLLHCPDTWASKAAALIAVVCSVVYTRVGS